MCERRNNGNRASVSVVSMQCAIHAFSCQVSFREGRQSSPRAGNRIARKAFFKRQSRSGQQEYPPSPKIGLDNLAGLSAPLSVPRGWVWIGVPWLTCDHQQRTPAILESGRRSRRAEQCCSAFQPAQGALDANTGVRELLHRSFSTYSGLFSHRGSPTLFLRSIHD